jgi:hypothetical protein
MMPSSEWFQAGETVMRDVSHRAAATLALGLLTDDLFGALMEAPSLPSSDDRNAAFANYVAANRWLSDLDREPATTHPHRRVN